MGDLVGQTLDRYEITDLIDEGGMATVYRGRHHRLKRDVAVKAMLPELASDPIFRERFEREAQAIANLRHPNILTVYDYGETDDGQLYLVVDYMQRSTLRQRLRQAIPWEEAVEIVAQVAEALDYAHQQEVIHRDVKPNNILLTRDGRALLADFGLAKPVRGDRRLTASGVVLGTPDYMAPEQAQDFAIDGRADIYALGVALFEMLTGRHPFEGETPMSIVVKHITEPMPAPSEFDPAVPQALADLERAVALEPDNATVYSMQANRPWWLGDLDAALRAYDRFIQLEPDEWIGYLARAVLRFEVGDLTSSLDAWNKVAAIKPDSKYLPVGRGLVYEKLGQTELAEADYAQVREVSAGSDPLGQFVQIVAFSPQLQIPIPAYFDLSDRTGYRARGEVEKAFEHCGKAPEVDPAYADALWKRGQLYADQGDWEAVTNDYTAAIEADALWPWFYYLRAQALAELGRIDEAQADLQQALELNPVGELRQQIDDFDLER